MARSHDVAIIGAGIGGLTAALTLHRAGCRVRIYEAVSELKALGVGINLLPHSVKALIDLGLQEELDATAILTGSLRYHAKDGKTVWSEPRGLDAGYPCPQYSIHRGELQMLLLKAVTRELGEGAVTTGRTFVGAEQDADGVSVALADSATGATETVRAECLVGADGIMSAVRAAFYPDEGNPVYAGQVLWRGVTCSTPMRASRIGPSFAPAAVASS